MEKEFRKTAVNFEDWVCRRIWLNPCPGKMAPNHDYYIGELWTATVFQVSTPTVIAG